VRVEFVHGAAIELIEVTDYYNEQREGLGRDF